MLSYSNLEKLFWCVLLAFLACFASVRVMGLQPDAALYAGLARRVLETGEAWNLRVSEEMFPRFFEHPPYFFQWGSWLMSLGGVNEVTAKAMGALPSFFAMILLILFCFKVWGIELALWTTFVLATTGHFTKYAATSMIEGPLALGVLMAALGVYASYIFTKNWMRLLAYLFVGLGVALACSMKGVVGLGAVGGALLVFVGQIFLENRSLTRLIYLPFYASFLFFCGAIPFVFWGIQAFYNPEVLISIQGYFFEQVLRSATTNRGEEFFKEANNYFYFLKVIVMNVWPWWWAAPIAFWGIFRKKSAYIDRSWRLWGLVAAAFFIAFLIPLSLVKYKLPHYMHPTYMLMAPLGAKALMEIVKNLKIKKINNLSGLWPRWGLLLLACAVAWVPRARVSRSENRGQEFIAVSERLDNFSKGCTLLVPKEEMEKYRMAAFSLWYFKGREWKLIENHYPSAIAIPNDAIYWGPQSSQIWVGSECR